MRSTHHYIITIFKSHSLEESQNKRVQLEMKRLRSRKLFKATSKASGGAKCRREIEWELRPGGMLVQKRREVGADESDGMINVRVSNSLLWLDITINATATFGELKMLVAMEIGLEVREQRLLFKGKEREDGDQLHMVGVKGGDKVLLLEDPAMKDIKLGGIVIAMKAMEINASHPAALLA